MKITLEDSARLRELLEYLRDQECIAYLDEGGDVIHAAPPPERSLADIVYMWAAERGLSVTLGGE